MVDILTTIFAGIPEIETTGASTNLPFTLSKINISTTFILYFSVVFIIVIDLFAALILGLVHKGSEKEGFRYMLPILALSLSVFFISRLVVGTFIKGFF